jgi:serine/threonine-protein kinase
MNQAALMEYEKMPPGADNLIDNDDLMKSYAYGITGNTVKAKQLLEKAIREHPQTSAYRIAQAYIGMGDYDHALNYLEEGYRVHGLHMFCMPVDPVFDPIRNQPRFIALLKNIGVQ